MTDAHLICKNEDHWAPHEDGLFRTGYWRVSEENADRILNSGGRVHLHLEQKAGSWHGGRLVSWKFEGGNKKKVFFYRPDETFGVMHHRQWARERAIVTHPEL